MKKIDECLKKKMRPGKFLSLFLSLFFTFLFLFSISVNGQELKTVSGKVADQSGQPLPGVTVVVKGTTQGTVTNGDGDYSLLTIPANATLEFSFVGMRAQEVVVGNQTRIDIRMEEETIGLEEVVAVGYGTQRKREVTGSISNVDLNDYKLTNIPKGQLSQKLQGQIAGVQILQTNGIPGRDLAIRIRGAASINAGNNPLYVIDGFPVETGMNMINPDEVDNISILKGSSASSLYGSRAGNGVVLITTKRAKEGQTIVNFNAVFGFSQVPQKGRPELMNAKEFLTDRKAYWEDKIRYEGYTDGVPELYQNPEGWTGPDTDWYDVILQQPAYQSSYNLSLLSSKGKFSTANMVGYYKEDGALINSGYQRFSLRSNNDYEVNDHIRVGFNIAPSYQMSDELNNATGQFNIAYAAIVTPPIFSPDEKNPDGSTVQSFTGPGLFKFPNWKRTLTEQTYKVNQFRLLSNMYGEVDFLKNFKFRSSFSVDFRDGIDRRFYPSTMGPTIWTAPPRKATGSYSASNSIFWLAENNLSFSKTFATNHNVNALLGFDAQKSRVESIGMSGNNFPNDDIPWLSNATNITSWSNVVTEYSLLSLYSRLNYNYKSKYLLSVSIRQDGSSRFGSNNRWGSFPSVSAGWIISDENFAKELPVVNYLKLRAEYGVVGNYNIGNYSHFGNIIPTNYVFGNSLAAGYSQGTIGNSELGWETTEGMGVGLDIGAFKDRVALSFDYYNKSTTDMLYQVDIPWGTGFSNIQDNIGEFHFWGYEVTLDTKNLVGSFKWNTNFNISINRNEVIKLGTNNTPIGASSLWINNVNRTEVGHPIGVFYGFLSDGVYMTQEEFDTQPKHYTSMVGTGRYKDINKDGVIDNYDRTFIGDPNPKFAFGISNSFSYKNFDLDVIITGAYGGDRARTLLEWSEILEGNFNVEKYVIDRWRSLESPGAGIIGRSFSGTTEFPETAQSRWIEDASYLTVKSISLGYNILPKIKRVSKARVFVSVQQAVVLTKYNGPNPEASAFGLNGLREGIDDAGYPVPRTFAFGLDFSF